MIFEDGFFHADPHPGNIMVKEPDGELVFLDFGMVGAIDSETRVSIIKILLAALEKDASRVVAYIEEDIPVSYTHLDVYKRQFFNCAGNIFIVSF